MNGISVIVPVYNTAEYLRACVDSILNQSCQPQEILLVDDGSTDGSGAICDEYARKYPLLIRTIHQANAGSSAARNRGLDEAKGKVISFMDSDDYIDREMFDILSKMLCGADMAACEMVLENPDGSRYCRINEEICLQWDTRQALVELNSYRYLHTSFCNALFQREAIGELRFREGIRCEDYDLLYQVVARCKNVAYCSKPLYHYVQRAQSNSRTADISLSPMEISLKQLAFFEKQFPEIAYAAETDCAFSHMGIFTAYIRNGAECPPELLKNLRAETRKHLTAVRNNPHIPLIKKVQAVVFCLSPILYKAVIGRTEHR